MASHVLPEFMYEHFYAREHRFREFSVRVEDRPKIHQKGLRKRLLCDDCEQRFGRYENYAAEAFYRPAVQQASAAEREIVIGGLDYATCKLFFLSLIWRLGHATGTAFTPADLGRHSETVRAMLLSDDPGDWLEFPCVITALRFNGKYYGDYTTGVFHLENAGHEFWGFPVSGLHFRFLAPSTEPAPRVLTNYFLRPGGNLRIAVEQMESGTPLYEHAIEVGRADERRRRP